MNSEKLNQELEDAELDDELLEQATGTAAAGRTHMPPDVEHTGLPGGVEKEGEPQPLITPPASTNFV